MTPKELRKQVVDKIYEGKTHQLVYDELNALYPSREQDLAKVIASVPSMEQRNKYSILIIALIVLLAISILLKVAAGLMLSDSLGAWAIPVALVLPIINIVLLVGVVTWNPRAYKPIAYLSILGLLQLLKPLLADEFDPYILIDLGLVAGLIFFGFFLGSKLGGNYSVGSQRYKDALGNVKVRQVVQWKE